MRARGSEPSHASDSPPVDGLIDPRVARLGPRDHGVALLVFIFISLAWFLPLPLHAFTRLPGYGDIWLTTWNFWWMKKALLELGTSPWFTDWVFWPQGVDLSLHALSPLNSLFSIPLQLLGGIPLAYNVIFLAAFALSGYAAFLIAHDLTADRAAAYFAGYAFAFSPFHWSHLHHLEHLSIQWPAFLVWALFKARATWMGPDGTNGSRWMATAGLFHAMTGYVNPYLGLFCGVLVAAAFLRDAWRRGAGCVRFWLPYLAVAGLLLAPLAVLMFRATALEGSFRVPLWIKVHQSIDLLALITPSPNNPWLRGWFPLMPLYGTFTAGEPIGYLGWSVIGLALWGAWRARFRERRFLAACALLFLLLAMGPFLHVAGIVRLPGGDPVPLPQLVLQLLPGISAARVPARYLAMATLFVALLAGAGLADLRLRRLRPGRFTVLVFALLVLEYWNAPFAATEPLRPRYTALLASEERDVAVLDLPVRIAQDPAEWWRSMDPGDQGWRQALHGKRTLTGSISHTALQARHFRFFLDSPLLAPLVSNDPGPLVAEPGEARRQAQELKLGFIVLHRGVYSRMERGSLERDRAYIRDILDSSLLYSDEEVEVWRPSWIVGAS